LLLSENTGHDEPHESRPGNPLARHRVRAAALGQRTSEYYEVIASSPPGAWASSPEHGARQAKRFARLIARIDALKTKLGLDDENAGAPDGQTAGAPDEKEEDQS